jgi:hypothetical protein
MPRPLTLLAVLTLLVVTLRNPFAAFPAPGPEVETPASTQSPAPAPAKGPGWVEGFDGDSLSKDWHRENPDDDHFVVEKGKAVIICRGLKQKKPYNRLVLKKELPRDLEATLDFQIERKDNQWLSLAIEQDENNYVAASVIHNDNSSQTFLQLWKVIGGQENKVDTHCMRYLPAKQTFRLTLRKEGRNFVATLKADKGECKLEQTVLRINAQRLAIWASNHSDSEAQKEVQLDRFELKDLGR